MFKVMDLFSGLGGFSLGLQRTGGFRTVAFCEIDIFCRYVLLKHWPGVPLYSDVRELTGAQLRWDGIDIDVICGGSPCQDISTAGKGAGLAGDRSRLWFEMLRIIGEVRPAWAIIENVAVLRSRGLETVLRGLASFGYDAEWHCIPASAVGAPHRRDRIWIVAHAAGQRERSGAHECGSMGGRGLFMERAGTGGNLVDRGAALAHAAGADDGSGDAGACHRSEPQSGSRGGARDVSDAGVQGLSEPEQPGEPEEPSMGGAGLRAAVAEPGWWAIEPDVGRVADGVPGRVDRLRALGNSVVPQVVELIGRAILRRIAFSQLKVDTEGLRSP